MNKTLKRAIVLILAILLFIPCFVNAQNITQEENPALIIKGTLISKKGIPQKNQTMRAYITTDKTTVDTHRGEQKKPGLGKKIIGTGTLSMKIEGMTGGGAYKMIDGKIINPQAKTDANGIFQFNVSEKFIDGEEDLIIAVAYQDYSASYTTKYYSLVDNEGNPLFVKIVDDVKIIDLGKVRSLIR